MVEERGTNYEGWGVKGKRIYEEGSIHSSSFLHSRLPSTSKDSWVPHSA